jgi:ribonuclease Z
MSSRTCRWLTFLLLLFAASPETRAQTLTVVLLGTGSPEPATDRFGPGTLVEAGNQRLLFDAGRGVSQRLWQLPVRLGDINDVFLTHLHSDHTVGLPDFWLTSWLQSPFGRRSSPLRVWGPPGTAALVKGLREAYAADVGARTMAGIPDSAVAIEGRDIEEGVLYDRAGVRVTGFRVDHGNPPIPAFGYRIDYGGRSIVISGDTRFSENLIRFARGADVLIHEVMAAFPEAQGSPAVNRILSSHTSPEDAGRVFAAVNPKLAIYTHVSLVSVPERRASLLETLLPRTRSNYSRRVVIGEDLMTVLIGDTIEIRRRANDRR